MAIRYITTVADRVLRFCPSCDAVHPIYVMEDDKAKERLTCCCSCQWISKCENM